MAGQLRTKLQITQSKENVRNHDGDRKKEIGENMR